ncbi:MAG TPA: GIY-YIG nuclease family protein [Candidatus Paceibacterota bacterium]|nr:GIY-YIG nuclease family protein [Candidatus Paceibacterota bacterium]HQI25784.1 GIY-YIG nuclease family protein [Candidatus Paceibacterota bacterium]HQJ83724.1 GIY-YIG nuclease family protein [Candidatus Paceibacterota bacterium]
MYTVYILYSHKDKKLYTGCTSNIEKRVKSHNSGSVIHPRRMF